MAALSQSGAVGHAADLTLASPPNIASGNEFPALLLRIASDLDLQGNPRSDWLDVRTTGIAAR